MLIDHTGKASGDWFIQCPGQGFRPASPSPSANACHSKSVLLCTPCFSCPLLAWVLHCTCGQSLALCMHIYLLAATVCFSYPLWGDGVESGHVGATYLENVCNEEVPLLLLHPGQLFLWPTPCPGSDAGEHQVPVQGLDRSWLSPLV